MRIKRNRGSKNKQQKGGEGGEGGGGVGGGRGTQKKDSVTTTVLKTLSINRN